MFDSISPLYQAMMKVVVSPPHQKVTKLCVVTPVYDYTHLPPELYASSSLKPEVQYNQYNMS